MDGATGAGGRWFLGRLVPQSFDHRVVTIAAGTSRPYDAAEWRGAIVVVDRGEVVLETLEGCRHHFGAGALVWLDGIRLRAVRSGDDEDAVLVAVSRRGPQVSATAGCAPT